MDGKQALDKVAGWHPDLVMLDLGLPDMDGLDVIGLICEWSRVPIIVISVREQEETKVRALDLGADDYLTKPFGMHEVLARLRDALRHASALTPDEPTIRFGDIEIDLHRRQVRRAGTVLHLTPTEYDLLRVFITNPGRVLTQRYLLRVVWGPGYEDDAHTLRVFVAQLRRKIEPDLE